MNPIVIYQTKMGSSQQYAEWIAEAIGCPVVERQQLEAADWQSRDMIIYVASIYVGTVIGFKQLLKQVGDLDQKKLILCMVGMTDLNQTEEFDNFFHQNVPEALRKKVRSFNLRGNLIYSKLGLVDRLLLKVPKRMARNNQADQLDKDNYFIHHFGEDVYYMQKDAIKPVVDYYNDLDMRARGI